MNACGLFASSLLVVVCGSIDAQELREDARQSKKKVALQELESIPGGKILWERSGKNIIGFQLRADQRLTKEILEKFEKAQKIGNFGYLYTPSTLKRDLTEEELATVNAWLKTDVYKEKVFNLRSTKVNLKWIKALEDGLKHVMGLDLSLTQITDEELSELNKYRQLKVLNLTATNIKKPEKIKELSKLTELYLRSTGVSDAGLETISKNQKELKILDLGQLKNLSDKGVKTLPALKDNLQKLDLGFNKGVTDESVSALKKLTKLQVLILEGTKISENKRTELMEELRGRIQRGLRHLLILFVALFELGQPVL